VKFFIKSSFKSRTLKTAIAILNGLYPQETGNEYINKYDISPQEAIPLRSQYRDLTPNDLVAFSLNEEWAISNMEIGEEENDYFFHAYKDDNCPIADRLIETYMESVEYKEVETFFEKTVYARLEWQINTVLGKNKIDKAALTIKKAKKVLDNWRCNTFHKLDHPRFNSLTVGLLKALMQYQVYIVTFQERLIRAIATSNIFGTMSTFTKGIVNDRENTPKFVLYSGHDTNLEPMLYNLLDEDEILRREEYTIIPFASVLSVSVYKDLDNGGELFVQVTFNDRPLMLKWCGGDKCPLETFQNRLDSYSLPNVEEYCASTR